MDFGWEQEYRDFREEVRTLVREHQTPELRSQQMETREGRPGQIGRASCRERVYVLV